VIGLLGIDAHLPSMLKAMPLAASTPVKAVPVNWRPWSVLKISGLPCAGGGQSFRFPSAASAF